MEVEDAAALPSPKALKALPRAPALHHDKEKWTKYFLEPQGIEALRTVRAGGLERLGDIADVDVGLVTGRNQFFVMRPSGAKERDIARHLGYKCSIRKNWWAVPSQWTPDAFLLRQIYDHPRIVANLTEATSTDTIHRVRMLNGIPPTKLAAAAINSATFAFSEVMGRSYGGGVLELEPREAEDLPIPDPKGLPTQDVSKVDALLRGGELTAALDYVDRKLLAHLDDDLVAQLRGIWELLRDRRLARGRKSS